MFVRLSSEHVCVCSGGGVWEGEGSAHLWRHQSPWKICCCSPHVVRNSTQPDFSRTALHSARVADVVNQFSLPQTVIASYKSHHIAWNGRISNRALLQCVFRIMLNESPPSVLSCWLPRKHLLSHLPLFPVCLTPLPRGNKKIKYKKEQQNISL